MPDDLIQRRIVYSVPGMDRVKSERDVTYRTVDGVELKMDVYVPPGLSANERRPVVFFIHGGPVPPGKGAKNMGVFRSYGELAAASGFVGVTFNHRLYALTDYERSAEDVAAASAFVRESPGRFHADAGRTAVWAFSGGGPLLGFAFRNPPPHLKAVVSYYAILDVRGVTDSVGNPVSEDVARRWSPAYDVETGAGPFPPTLIARAGRDDARINASAETFVRAAWAKGMVIDVLNHAEGRHGFDILDDDERSREVIRRTVEFLQTRLGP